MKYTAWRVQSFRKHLSTEFEWFGGEIPMVQFGETFQISYK